MGVTAESFVAPLSNLAVFSSADCLHPCSTTRAIGVW